MTTENQRQTEEQVVMLRGIAESTHSRLVSIDDKLDLLIGMDGKLDVLIELQRETVAEIRDQQKGFAAINMNLTKLMDLFREQHQETMYTLRGIRDAVDSSGR